MKHSSYENLWGRRFREIDVQFLGGVKEITEMGFALPVFIHQFPLFTGHVNMARYLALYESFKMVQGIAGNYADVGTFRGASLLWIAKLIKLFEPYSTSQVHAFDWFMGHQGDDILQMQAQPDPFQKLRKLINVQGLTDIIVLHQLDLSKDLDQFDNDPICAPLYFKYVFMDCGFQEVLEKAVPFFWDKLLTGGIMVFDHFTSDIQVETEIVKEVLPPDTAIQNWPWCRQPMGYVIK